MSVERITTGAAGGIVRARLGRPAQDELEAVVVLEAWGGVPTARAFEVGGGALPAAAGVDDPSRHPLPARPAEGRAGIVAEGVALLVAIVAVAVWAGPLSRQLGAGALERALLIALPLTLALQWGLRSRHLSRRAGLRLVAEERVPLLGLAAVLGTVLVLTPRGGPLAAAFVAIWVAGTLLAQRGWGLLYAALVLGEAIALGLDAPAALSLAALAGVTAAAVLVAIASAGAPAQESPGRLGRALAAAAIGALLGGVLVGDASLGWGVQGAFPALALVPSVAGSLWGGYHLWQLHEAIPVRLRGVPLAEAADTVARGPATAIVTGALARLLGATAVLSLLVIAAGRWTHGTDRTSLFVAFGCAALVCLLVSLHESLGASRWAFLSAAIALAVVLAAQRWLPVAAPGGAVPGAGLILGSIAGALIALAPLLVRLRSPGRVLATSLWIR